MVFHGTNLFTPNLQMLIDLQAAGACRARPPPLPPEFTTDLLPLEELME